MNDNEIRDRLAVAMTSSARGNTYTQWADTILPTVRAIVADELRAAARHESRWHSQPAAGRLLDRADEMDPGAEEAS